MLTQGATGLDFADTGTRTCTTNGTAHTYNAGDSCTVNVVFTPKYSGTRYGAVHILNSSSTIIATGYVVGTGAGPQVNFLPGSQLTVASSSVLHTPSGVVVDASGNVYIADQQHDRVAKETPSASGYIDSTILSGFAPSALALDGGGSLYVLNASGGVVLKETPSASGYVQSTVTTNSYMQSMTADWSGNVYITTYFGFPQLKESPTPAGYLQSTIPTTGLNDPFGIAVDGSENLYISDTNNLRVVKETLSPNGTYIQSNLPANNLTSQAYGVAADANGNVYVSDVGQEAVFKFSPSGGSYTESTIVSNGLNSPAGMSIDGYGNLLISDSGNNRVIEENYTQPPALSFGSTAFGALSSDSPKTMTVENIGSSALTFPVPASGNNPSIAASFVLNGSGSSTCPIVDSGSSTPGTLAVGASCELSVSFIPATVGAIGGSLVLTDNALNAAAPGYASQSIALSGTATQATPANTLSSSASAVFATTPVTFTATVASSDGSPTGMVTFFDGGTQIATATLSSGRAEYTTSSLAAGAHSITAAYSGDSNFAAGTSAVLTETVVSLTITGATTATTSPGRQATYALAFAPSGGTTFPGAIQLTKPFGFARRGHGKLQSQSDSFRSGFNECHIDSYPARVVPRISPRNPSAMAHFRLPWCCSCCHLRAASVEPAWDYEAQG